MNTESWTFSRVCIGHSKRVRGGGEPAAYPVARPGATVGSGVDVFLGEPAT